MSYNTLYTILSIRDLGQWIIVWTYVRFKVVNAEDDLSGSFIHIIEAGLKYISMVAKETEKHSQHLTAKFWRALLHKAYEILDKVRL